MKIAQTIRQQLGGRALVMLGAHSLVATERGLMFGFKGCRAANKLVIELAADDTYTLAFWKMGAARSFNNVKVRELDMVHAAELHQSIELVTGLATRL